MPKEVLASWITWSILAFLPTIIGVLSVLFIDEKNRKILTVIYHIMLALLVIPSLYVLFLIWDIIVWNLGRFEVIFVFVALISAVAVQLALMKRFFDSVKARMILLLTIMATPLFIWSAILIAEVFGLFIQTN
ncbi:MAG: hypothetical protein FWE85_05125 [Clostridiales bacterium]|nr:hypothetical protein [Clostridiales bacterium]